MATQGDGDLVDNERPKTKIRLHGLLGDRFGHEFSLYAQSPAMAIRGLCANLRGFAHFVSTSEAEGIYYEFLSDGRSLETEMIHGPVSGDLDLIPVVAGAGAFGQILLGAGLIGASFAIPGAAAISIGASSIALSSTALTLGAAIALQGVNRLIQGTFNNTEEVESESFIFTSSLRTSQQGRPFPLLIGTHLIDLNSTVILSSGVASVDIPIETISSGSGKSGGK